MGVAGCRRGLAAVLATSLLVVSCSGPSPEDEPELDPPASSGGDSGVDVVPVDEAAGGDPQGSGALLSEVRFAPDGDDGTFVEIVNAGPDPVTASGLVLDVDGQLVPIESDEENLEPGAVLAVDVALAAAGTAELRNATGQVLDRVVWGGGQAGALPTGLGDIVADEVEPGISIGRPLGSGQPQDVTSWAPYPPADASPGEPNPVPRVEVLLPMAGSILVGRTPTLEWYPVPGAAAYTVEIASDEDFTDVVVETTVTEPLLVNDDLDPAPYYWRVEALGPADQRSGPSNASAFELVTSEDARTSSRATGARKLSVPWLVQHKDTSMLLLELKDENGPLAWDRPHNPPGPRNPADAKNCALAMTAMINHFYGGDLSQDRIGYQVYKDREPGPEWDLNYGTAIPILIVTKALTYALGEPVTLIPEFASYDDAWAEITAAIDSGVPMAGAGPGHGYVVTGYRIESNGHRVMLYNDPARGLGEADLDGHGTNPNDLSLWRLPQSARGTKQEAAVTRDADGDGVVDFDETERFKTDPTRADSDDDQLPDKQDIITGVFDTEHGYALNPLRSTGRDFDGDDLPTERDPDSDNGQCRDGEEDVNLDGHKNGRETWNFDLTDDSCFALLGTIDYKREGTYDSGPGASRQTASEKTTISVDVRMKADPDDPSALVDDGSSFTVNRVTNARREVGGDCNPSTNINRSKGTYTFEDPPVPSPGWTLEDIGGNKSAIEAILVPELARVILIIVPYYPENRDGTCPTVTVPSLPIVVDFLACDEEEQFTGLVGKVVDDPSGADSLDVKCKREGPSPFYNYEKVTTSGTLRLVTRG